MGKPRRLSFIPTSRAIAPWAAIGLLILVSLPGCGPKSDRLAISGKVTLNGAPLDLGSIRFSSNGGGKLFASGAMVKDGEYHIPQPKACRREPIAWKSIRLIRKRRWSSIDLRQASRPLRQRRQSEFRPNTTEQQAVG